MPMLTWALLMVTTALFDISVLWINMQVHSTSNGDVAAFLPPIAVDRFVAYPKPLYGPEQAFDTCRRS